MKKIDIRTLCTDIVTAGHPAYSQNMGIDEKLPFNYTLIIHFAVSNVNNLLTKNLVILLKVDNLLCKWHFLAFLLHPYIFRPFFLIQACIITVSMPVGSNSQINLIIFVNISKT